MKTVGTPGAFDTKGPDYKYLVDAIRSYGVGVLTIDFGVLGAPSFTPDISSAEVARAGGASIDVLRESGDKTRAMRVMADGLARTLLRLYEEGRLHGVCGMGGTGGTTILSAGVRGLPIGVPKLLVSTVAAGDLSPYVGSADMTMMHSVVDVAGLNRISREIYTNAAAAIAGMVQAPRPESDELPVIAASMFGNTTACIDQARDQLTRSGYEALVFHATGSGGRTMQRLVAEGHIAGLLDLTTTELADEVCGGVFSAGLERIEMGAKSAIPVVLAPGCVDMCNFGPRESVPEKYSSRLLYEWNENVTLMRTNTEENREIGRLIADTANRCAGPASVLIPKQGVSMLDSPTGPFWDEAADRACLDGIRSNLRDGIPLVEIGCNINDAAFASRAVQTLLDLSSRHDRTSAQRTVP
jgi:uncharacterized protein (UPF0261 family)